MGKFLHTVFGGNGIVSNLVDIITVPDLIKNKKNEVEQVQIQISDLDTKYSFLQEDGNITRKQAEINKVNRIIKMNENRLKQLLDSGSRRTHLIQETAQNIHYDQTKVNILIQEIASCRKNFATQQQSYTKEKTELNAKLMLLQTELDTLVCKLERKRGQLNNNFKAI